MYDYLRDELPQLIRSQFNVSERCAISGHSMGGHGALIMALKTRAVLPAFPLSRLSLTLRRFPGAKAFTAYLGADESTWQAWDSCALMQASQPDDAIPTLIDRGDSDIPRAAAAAGGVGGVRAAEIMAVNPANSARLRSQLLFHCFIYRRSSAFSCPLSAGLISCRYAAASVAAHRFPLARPPLQGMSYSTITVSLFSTAVFLSAQYREPV